ncbi:MAG: DUF2203 domain-containing protein [Acidobacteriota bacterium]|nr:DUF2203 domain-containing protein [Acidobacteriota bacterium]
MKVFTVAEANDLLLEIRPKLEIIRGCYAATQQLRESAKAAARKSESGGGMKSGTVYVKALYEIGKLTTELTAIGVQIKDYSRGLIDFPCRRDDEIILLCWQLGEGDEIEWWHEIETGFAGRKVLDFGF